MNASLDDTTDSVAESHDSEDQFVRPKPKRASSRAAAAKANSAFATKPAAPLPPIPMPVINNSPIPVIASVDKAGPLLAGNIC